MMNTIQKSPSLNGNYFNFKPEDYFYYKVKLNYTDFTYKVYDVKTNGLVGFDGNPIKWYEYVNP